MIYRILFLVFIISFSGRQIFAQYDAPLYAAYTTDASRAKLKDRLIKNSITKGLSVPLSDSTEEYWQDAFDAMEVLEYSTPYTLHQVRFAFHQVLQRSVSFQRALIEVAYTLYPGMFYAKTQELMQNTSDPKIFAICAEYLVQNKNDRTLSDGISQKLFEKFGDSVLVNPVLLMLQSRLKTPVLNYHRTKEVLKTILTKDFLPDQIVMYSFQRKNRDYPGIVIIRNAAGDFVKDSAGSIFHVPQLARSITNLPGYLRNGNTPQGIFRMYGFGVSMSSFIGPTANVQMGMPIELSLQKFFDKDTITDSVWTMGYYQQLIPERLRNYLPLYDSYYAGQAGRSEIIAHGTAIDPNYYRGKSYYPLTPTQGCLCTKEIWDGERIESDQQKLVNGLLQAGGANGYVVVLELDNKNAPVTMGDIQHYLPN